MKTIVKVFLFISIISPFFDSYAQDYSGSFEFEGKIRTYEVYLPQDYQPSMPVVISLHGYTETVEWYKNYTLLHEHGDSSGFITVYPKSASISWNTGETVPPYGWPPYDDTVDDVGFISALIDTLHKNYNIDLSRVYCCGFSSGGEMAFRLAVELVNRLAAIASVNGPLNDVSASDIPVRSIPIVYIHGTKDKYINYEEPYSNLWSVQSTINYWSEQNDCSPFYNIVSLPDIVATDNCTVDKISYTDCTNDYNIVHYKINEGGHNWPSFVNITPESFEGNKTRDIDANTEIWNFFKNFSLPAVSVDTGIINSSFMFEGLSRDYIVYIPQNFQPNMPVIVMLHGSYPDHAQWMMHYTQMNEIADTAGFIVVYPYSIEPRWNANAGLPNKTEPNVNDVGFISALIDTLNVHYQVDMARVYCCGLNYGGWMASELICQIGHRFAAGARVNTSLGDNQAARSTLNGSFPIVLFNGTADTYLPWPEGREGVMGGEEAVSWWVEQNNCSLIADTVSLPDLDPTDNCTVEKISYTDCSDEVDVVFYKVINGGLSWPSAVGNETWDKPRNNDINAGAEIWNFFKNYTKSEENTTTEIWTDKTDMLNKRQGHSSGVLDGKIYVLGGIQFNSSSTHYNAIKSMEFYDISKNAWTEKADMNTGRVQFPTCIYNGKIWAIGGGQSVYWDPLTSIEEYDPYFNIWSHKTNMPRARMGHTASLVNGKIYIIGGAASNAMIPLSEIVVYDPLTDTWDSTKTDMPNARMNLEAVVLNSKIYVMGGHGGTPGGELGLKKVEAYDPATEQWEDKADMIRARKYFSACVVDGKIYVFGGAINCSSAWSTVEVYDPDTDNWTSGTDISTKWVMTAAASINENIYVSGGTFQICPPSVVKTVRVYNPAQDTLLALEIINRHNQQQPESFAISQNYPNPFNPSTTFKYEVPKESYITLKVYDILGREVATLVNKQQKAGFYEVDWNAVNNSSGIYFYRIQAGDFVETKKMVLMK